MKTRNSEVLKSFSKYCDAHPQERFWQALRNWCGYNFVMVSNDPSKHEGYTHDTFDWEGKDVGR